MFDIFSLEIFGVDFPGIFVIYTIGLGYWWFFQEYNEPNHTSSNSKTNHKNKDNEDNEDNQDNEDNEDNDTTAGDLLEKRKYQGESKESKESKESEESEKWSDEPSEGWERPVLPDTDLREAERITNDYIEYTAENGQTVRIKHNADNEPVDVWIKE